MSSGWGGEAGRVRVRAIGGRVLLGLVIVAVVVAGVSLLDIGDDDTGGGSATSSTVVRRGGAAVTEADNGGEVTVPLNQPFVVNLKGSPAAPWGLPHAESESLALVKTSEELDGSVTATFVPQRLAPGVVVRAERGGPSPETFAVTIRVVG
ncbi:MAG: hypothetical protein QOG82_540 [Actinomycetota bacterium]|nr:hypothetical protein [Actinomycetota bacterium]